MKEYELVHEIQNLCRNNQMRDIFFEEIECDDPETWLRNKYPGKDLKLAVDRSVGGAVTIHAEVDGLLQKFVFTPI